MSNLIDNFLFYKINHINNKNIYKSITKLSQSSCLYQNFHQSQFSASKTLPKSPLNIYFDNILIKQKQYCLILHKNFINHEFYRIQGLILKSDYKFIIQSHQKRILMGKQYIKIRQINNIIMTINMLTGEVKLFWSEIFNIQNQIDEVKLHKKKIQLLFIEFIQFFKDKFMFLIKRICEAAQIIEEQTIINDPEKDTKKNNLTDYQQIFIMQKYLFMCTITDNFQREKQSYNKVEDGILREKQDIMKIQKNIDVQFSYVLNEIKLFSNNSVKNQRVKLAHFGQLTSEQKNYLSEICQIHKEKTKFQVEQFILNCIGILKVQNKKKFLTSCGTSNIFAIKILFQYIFSDDPRYWIEFNKKTSNNIIEKLLVVKQSKRGYSEKIKHQNEIVRQMKAGYSIYLPRYYKIQHAQSTGTLKDNQDILLMDYLNGDKFDYFHEKNKLSMSFWTKIFLIKHLVNGLRFLSSYEITHLDLKPDNIIVVHGLLTKIIDFGQSYHPKVCKDKIYRPGISLPYGCPQMLSKQISYNEKCDVYSLGVIMFEFFLNRPIFQCSNEKIAQIYKKKQYMDRVYICPQSQQDCNLTPIFNIILLLISKCLQKQPKNRPTLNWLYIILQSLLSYFKSK